MAIADDIRPAEEQTRLNRSFLLGELWASVEGVAATKSREKLVTAQKELEAKQAEASKKLPKVLIRFGLMELGFWVVLLLFLIYFLEMEFDTTMWALIAILFLGSGTMNAWGLLRMWRQKRADAYLLTYAPSLPADAAGAIVISSEPTSRLVHKVSDISIETDVLAENRKLGHENHHRLRAHGIRSLDVMGAIGSGKTLLIQKMAVRMMEKGLKVAVLAGDLTGQDDFDRFRKAGVAAVNVNTGKECHLDAHLVDHALDKLDLDDLDFLFIENVGNLVCPADFPLGTDQRMVVISVTEGDDMVRKQPGIFIESDIAVLNKIDLLPFMDVDTSLMDRDYAKVKKGAKLYRTSAKTGEGLDELFKALNIQV